MDKKAAVAQETVDAGGAMIERTDGGIKVHLAIDPQNPMKIFDTLNELEINMIKQAARDMQKIAAAGRFVDDIRFKAKTMLKKMGIEVDVDVPESTMEAVVSEPVEL